MTKVEFTGPWFWPITSAISFFGTLSAIGTSLAPEHALPDFLAPWALGTSAGFYFIAVLVSGIAFLELLVSGVRNAGTLTWGGRRISPALLGLFFLLTYLMPWTFIIGALVMFSATGI